MPIQLFVVAIVCFAMFADCHKKGDHDSEEKVLIRHLLDNYNIYGKYGRPVKSMNSTVKVSYGINLVQIVDVNEKHQVLTTNVWCKYKWRDEGIYWIPEEHENIMSIRVPIDLIWKPDFVLYNYADERLAEHRETMALIYSDGYVTYIPPAIFKSTCSIDTTYFPFDEQSCHLKFGSWTYSGNALDLFFFDGKEYIELSDYMPSQGWIILEHWAQKQYAFYDCCPNEPYPDLTFHLKLRRRAAFYSYTLILPCVLLSFMTMVLFMLPPETPAKMSLGIQIFVAFFMLLLLLQESTPPTAKRIPILGAYYCFSMVMVTISTYLCALITDMHYRADKLNPPGRLVSYIFVTVLARALLIHIRPAMLKKLDAALHEQKVDRKLQDFEMKAGGFTCSCCCPQSTSKENLGRKISSPIHGPAKHLAATFKKNYRGPIRKEQEMLTLDKNSQSKSKGIRRYIRKKTIPNRSHGTSSWGRKRRRSSASSLDSRKFDEEQLYLSDCYEDAFLRQDDSAIYRAIDNEMNSIHFLMNRFLKRLAKREIEKRNIEVWRVIAMVTDRLCLFGYAISMIFSLTTLFPVRPPDPTSDPRFPNGTIITTRQAGP